ncbi:MAG TPA: TolC family protein [Burkholderiaceae bacterium]|nr:TolC family protein [Burkholderiaceae bacterium]
MKLPLFLKNLALWLLLPAIAGSAAQAAILPDEAQVRQALQQHPRVLAASAKRDAQFAKSEQLRAGSHQTTLRTSLQRRRVSDVNDHFGEGQVALERSFRLPQKARADASLAGLTEQAANIELQDALHETARELLRLWFAGTRTLAEAQHAEQAVRLHDDLASLVAKRVKAGDASRLEADLVQAERDRARAMLGLARARLQAAGQSVAARFPGVTLPEPMALPEWISPLPADAADAGRELLRAEYLAASHELRLARADAEHSRGIAQRQSLERLPDPTLGVFYSNERNGAERVIGLSVAIPFSGAGSAAGARAAYFEANAAQARVADLERKVGADFDMLWIDAQAKRSAALALADAARMQAEALRKTIRAYGLGEAPLADVLLARKASAESTLAARIAALDIAEATDRLRLDLHQIWDFDE